jgi:DNA invertase Pin-like site-specific DNA recombinase
MTTKAEATANVNIAHSYLRWSSEAQNWGDSERRQFERSKEICASKGWTLAERTFIDRGVSAWHGKNREQGALGELLRHVQPGEKIIIENVDRWSREDPNDSINALRQHIERGVEFYFGSIGRLVNRDSYREVRMMLNMQAEMACQYNERLSCRIREAMKGKREKLAKGVLAFGRLPAWLQWSAPRKHEGRKPLVVEAKATVVRKIFNLYLQGKSIMDIAVSMRGTTPISNCKKASWNGYFVYRLLNDRAVLGEHTPSGTPSIFPAIVSEADFLHVKEKLKARKHNTAARRIANSNLFAGLARCSRCQHTLTRLYSPRGDIKYFYLVCGGRARRVPDCKCDFRSVNYVAFEASFLSLLKESGLIRKMLSSDHSPSPLDDLKRILADVGKRADVLLNVLEETGADEDGRLGKPRRENRSQEGICGRKRAHNYCSN